MKPFLERKKSLDISPLRPGPAAAGQMQHAGGLCRPQSGVVPRVSSAQVEVVKEGGKIVRLVVTCLCGEHIEIECLYSPGS